MARESIFGESSEKAIYNVVIYGQFPSLNEYVDACRRNKYEGAKMKKECQTIVGWCIGRLPEITKPVKIKFTWNESTRRRDPDNVAFAKKFILDELVSQGKLHGDSPKYIRGFVDEFTYGGEPKVFVSLEEV